MMREKLKRLFKRDKTNRQEVPEAWLKNKPNITKNNKTGIVTVKFEPKHRIKLRIPGLRNMKRVLATFLVIFNFFIAQTALISAAATQPLALLFYLNCFIGIDYVWKTRKKTEVKWDK